MILLDGISLGLGLNEATAAEARGACQRFLTVQLTPLLGDAAAAALVASAALQNNSEAEAAPGFLASSLLAVQAAAFRGVGRLATVVPLLPAASKQPSV